MKKNVLFILSILLGSLICLVSCGDDDEVYDEAWKLYNDSIFYSLVGNSDYERLQSESENGFVFRKKYTAANSPFKSFHEVEGESPLFSDSVVCRYTGWYFSKEGDPLVFDGTENEVVINGKTINTNFNQKQGVGFRINNTSLIKNTYSVTDGMATALQSMKPGDECQICIPFMLGYGVNGLYTSSGSVLVPGYSTVWFDIKLLKVIRND